MTSKRRYTAREVSRLVDVPESRIRYWESRGILEAPPYEFRDLVSVRTLERLRKSGLSERRIITMERTLRQFFPEVRHPFSELRLTVEGKSRVLVQYRSAVFDPQGQLVLRF